MDIEKLLKKELVEYCKELGIETEDKLKDELKEAIYDYRDNQIREAVKKGTDNELLRNRIEKIAEDYSKTLDGKIEDRKIEMEKDDDSHYLIYRVLGVSEKRGKLIDQYQNTGRFLYKYAGSFLEKVTCLCFNFSNLEGGKHLVENTIGIKPKTFEIDFLDGNNAIEIKWRDATTDGDHITKEHTRVKAISDHGFKPIRIMFYYPQRKQAIRIQKTLKTIYKGTDGEYHAGDEAWKYVEDYTGYDLLSILKDIADKRAPKDEEE